MHKFTSNAALTARAKADAFLIYAATRFTPALAGGLAVVRRLVDEMTAASVGCTKAERS